MGILNDSGKIGGFVAGVLITSAVAVFLYASGYLGKTESVELATDPAHIIEGK